MTEANSPGESPVADDVASLPDYIGDYRVLDLLGEGGMGFVYLAEQETPIVRRVAVKVLKPGMDSKSVLARFETERQALALMDHPSIAKILDAGKTDSGRPYFVMEWVRGEPITRYCARHNVSVRERLDLFLAVCQAVQHAHHKAVIHRDLKPSNILVTISDDRAIPKIIDFGIAKATTLSLTERTLFTRLGQLLGTPEYMSPEQAATDGIDVDTRTDIYSLGVVLYEMLAGQLPFDRKEIHSLGTSGLQDFLETHEPPLPSRRASSAGESPAPVKATAAGTGAALSRQLKGDLDWIVLKAMAKDRTQRYETADALAQDIKRYLRDEPVTAGPPSLVYRVRKLARRNRVALAITAAVVFGILGSTIGLWKALHESRVQQARIAAALTETKKAREQSETVTAFLSQMLSAADPSQRGREITVLEVLDDAVRGIDEEFGDRPDLEVRLRTTIGKTYQALGRLRDAEVQLGRAVALGRKALGDDALETISAMESLGVLYGRQARYADAEPLLQQALEIRTRVYGAGHEGTIEAAANLGVLYKYQKRYAESETLYRRALGDASRTFGEDEAKVVPYRNNLAVLYWTLGRYREAEDLYASVLATRRRLSREGDPALLTTLNNVAALYEELGRRGDAEALLREAVEKSRKILGSDHPTSLLAMNNLARVLSVSGHAAEAEALQRPVVQTAREVLGADHPRTLAYTSNLANILRLRGQYRDAERLFHQTLDVQNKNGRFNDTAAIQTAVLLGELFLVEGRARDCATLFAEVRPAADRVLPEGHPGRGDVLRVAGVCDLELSKSAEAERALLEAHRLYAEALGPDRERTVRTARHLVTLYRTTGQTEQAEAWSKRLAGGQPAPAGAKP